MSWNYRVIVKGLDPIEDGEEWATSEVVYEVHEVYYDEYGVIVAWTENPVRARVYDGDSPGEYLLQLSKAFTSPYLKVSECGTKLVEVED